MAGVSLTPVNNRMGSECFLRHSEDTVTQPPSPLAPSCPMLWISEEGTRKWTQLPPPRPLAGPLSLTHQALQSRSLSVFLGRTATQAVREEHAAFLRGRPWAPQSGGQEHRRWQERTVRGPWWRPFTCFLTHGEPHFHCLEPGHQEDLKPEHLSCISNRIPRSSASSFISV